MQERQGGFLLEWKGKKESGRYSKRLVSDGGIDCDNWERKSLNGGGGGGEEKKVERTRVENGYGKRLGGDW